jgi:hypothetical protein
MVYPSASRSSCRPVVLARLVAVAAVLGVASCAPRVDVGEASARTSPALGRSDVAVVTIDAGATLSLDPGESAGLFVQYARGGHWNLTTTCDTRTSGQDCAFDVVISPAPGASFSGVEGQGLSRDDTVELRSDGTIRLVTSTSFGTNGITFDSDPGAVVEIDARLDGTDAPDFVNVVSDGAAASGVPGNPIDFSPSAP